MTLLRTLGVLGALGVAGCRAVMPSADTSVSPCVAAAGLSGPERALLDTLVVRALDGEALYTVAGRLKPMSSVDDLALRLARPDSVSGRPAEGRVLPLGPADTAALDSLERLTRVAARLRCDGLEAVVVPYRRAYDGQRTVAVSLVDRRLLAAELRRHAAFWGRMGFSESAEPAAVVTAVENAPTYDRFRGYGYLFGYPGYAVDFFVEAAREADSTGQFVPRRFFHVPVHTRPDGRYTWAMPQQHRPTEVDSARYRDGVATLVRYRALRARYTGPDGALRALALLAAVRAAESPLR